jgi:molybdenum cofactor cytidylyltransferase
MATRPVIVVLAAGRGRRARSRSGSSSSPPIHDGDAQLMRTLKTALATQLRVLVVVDGTAQQALASTQLAARDIVVLPDAPSNPPAGASTGLPGEGDAIAAGVAASGDADGWVLLPADAPVMQPQTLLAVAQALELHPVAYGQHRGRRGQPIGFSAELYSELMRLQGETGAGRLLARYPAQGVEVDDPAVLGELPSPAEALRLRAAL